MPEYIARATPKGASQLLAGYLDTLEWCELSEDGEREAFELSVSPAWTAESIKRAEGELAAFSETAEALLVGCDPYTVGHDFALTRNRHGAGFWDGDYEHGDALTQLCRPFGEVYVYFEAEGERLICE